MPDEKKSEKKGDPIGEFFNETAKMEEKETEENTMKILATREWLLGHITKTKKVKIGKEQYVEIRERISAEEQQKFPLVYKIFTSEKKDIVKEKKERLDTEFSRFLSYILVDPKLDSVGINTCLTEAEKTAIIAEFFFSVMSDINQKAIAFFR